MLHSRSLVLVRYYIVIDSDFCYGPVDSVLDGCLLEVWMHVRTMTHKCQPVLYMYYSYR